MAASPRPRASNVICPGLTLLPGAGRGSSTHGARPAASTVGVACGCGVGDGSARLVGSAVAAGRVGSTVRGASGVRVGGAAVAAGPRTSVGAVRPNGTASDAAPSAPNNAPTAD